MPEDSPHGRFVTWKIRHKKDSPHNECDREFERKRQTNVCNSADVEDLPHNGDRLKSGGGGRVEVEVGELGWAGGRRVGVGGLGLGGSGSGLPTP